VPHLIEVAFRGNRKEFFQWDEETAPALKSGVIVEADRGEDFGRVHSTGELAEVRCKGCAHGCGTTPPPRRALRLATPEELLLERELTAENETTRRRAMERVKANHLVMKLTDAEWQWDRRKLTLYFTAERRVDFRALVRDLAAMFRTRIELKQIGVRDEAKRLSGVGRCGREYCSSSWLPDLRPVNLGVAKDQKLSLNPQQISGACGRLMCCLRYEHEFYVQSRRRFPKEGKILQTSLGEEKVVSCDIFHDRVTLRTAEGDSRVVALAELRDEIGGFGDLQITDTHEVPSDTEEMAIDYDVASSSRRGRTYTPARGVPRQLPMAELRGTGTVPETAIADTTFAAPSSSPSPDVPESATTAASTLPPIAARVATESPAASMGAAQHAHDGSHHDTGNDTSDDSGDDVGDHVGDDVGDNDAAAGGVVVSTPTENSAEAGASDTRRKRRRGRRGGRRLRAAEQRRQLEPGAPQDGGDSTQHDDGDDAEDRDDERPDTAPTV